MRVLRPSSLEEYASWYLHRERRKGDTRPIPTAPQDQVQEMRQHPGKMREWFAGLTRWHVALLDRDELSRLVFLESDWTLGEGLVIPGTPNYRTLERVAAKADASNYFSPPTAEKPNEKRAKHREYLAALAAGAVRLSGDDRIAICSAEESEITQNPSARYYLLDGVGRCLPYMVLSMTPTMVFELVEAFVVERL